MRLASWLEHLWKRSAVISATSVAEVVRLRFELSRVRLPREVINLAFLGLRPPRTSRGRLWRRWLQWSMAEVELLEDRTQLTPMIYAATDLPLLVPPARPDSTGTVSTIHVADDFVVQDVNVLLNVEHSYVYQLNVVLIAPDGTRVELFTNTSFYWPRKFHCDSVRPASIPIVF